MSAAITMSTVRRARPGREREFESALHAFVQRSLELPGQLGVQVMRPAPDSSPAEYSIIRRFADRESLSAFQASADYRQWLVLAAELTEGSARSEHHYGLESWFTLPGMAVRPLPKWKLALLTFTGVFPVATALNLALGPVLAGWHFLLASLVFNASVVVLLTWLVMPLLTRLLHGWLDHSERTPKHESEPR